MASDTVNLKQWLADNDKDNILFNIVGNYDSFEDITLLFTKTQLRDAFSDQIRANGYLVARLMRQLQPYWDNATNNASGKPVINRGGGSSNSGQSKWVSASATISSNKVVYQSPGSEHTVPGLPNNLFIRGICIEYLNFMELLELRQVCWTLSAHIKIHFDENVGIRKIEDFVDWKWGLKDGSKSEIYTVMMKFDCDFDEEYRRRVQRMRDARYPTGYIVLENVTKNGDGMIGSYTLVLQGRKDSMIDFWKKVAPSGRIYNCFIGQITHSTAIFGFKVYIGEAAQSEIRSSDDMDRFDVTHFFRFPRNEMDTTGERVDAWDALIERIKDVKDDELQFCLTKFARAARLGLITIKEDRDVELPYHMPSIFIDRTRI